MSAEAQAQQNGSSTEQGGDWELLCLPENGRPGTSLDTNATDEEKTATGYRNKLLKKWESWKHRKDLTLAEVEAKIVGCLRSPYQIMDVRIFENGKEKVEIHTIKMLHNDTSRTPLVLVHGMGGGIGLWVQNLESLAEDRPVYAFDLLGFGRSSRPQFPGKEEEVENFYVASLEDWRKALGLEKFILLGHSLGGYVSSAYCRKYGQYVHHLILVDPWGMAEKPEDWAELYDVSYGVQTAVKFYSKYFNPMAVMRGVGPMGRKLIQKVRPDLRGRFACYIDDEIMYDYIYYSNARRPPSGEEAFRILCDLIGWAKLPMLPRLADIQPEVGITLIYGEDSWLSSATYGNLPMLRRGSFVDIRGIKDAGHHLYADKFAEFNAVINDICGSVDPPTC